MLTSLLGWRARYHERWREVYCLLIPTTVSHQYFFLCLPWGYGFYFNLTILCSCSPFVLVINVTREGCFNLWMTWFNIFQGSPLPEACPKNSKCSSTNVQCDKREFRFSGAFCRDTEQVRATYNFFFPFSSRLYIYGFLLDCISGIFISLRREILRSMQLQYRAWLNWSRQRCRVILQVLIPQLMLSWRAHCGIFSSRNRREVSWGRNTVPLRCDVWYNTVRYIHIHSNRGQFEVHVLILFLSQHAEERECWPWLVFITQWRILVCFFFFAPFLKLLALIYLVSLFRVGNWNVKSNHNLTTNIESHISGIDWLKFMMINCFDLNKPWI